jgi:hypothetical protein
MLDSFRKEHHDEDYDRNEVRYHAEVGPEDGPVGDGAGTHLPVWEGASTTVLGRIEHYY